jgi:hypothetical protein
MSASLTAKDLRELLHYCPESGVFKWLVKASHHRKPGDIAGYLNPNGYLYIKIKGKKYTAGRLAWLYVNGEFPTYYVDHIDGNKSNNKISNLRDVTNSTNQQNRKIARADNKCGLLGVCKVGNKFAAQITINRKQKNLGRFNSANDAHQAYLDAKRQLHDGCTI